MRVMSVSCIATVHDTSVVTTHTCLFCYKASVRKSRLVPYLSQICSLHSYCTQSCHQLDLSVYHGDTVQ